MPATLTILDLPASERPRERLTRLGAEALSDQELLACVLGRGVAGESVLISAQRLLKAFRGVRGLAGASVEQLSHVHGIGPAKAAQLKAAVALAGRAAAPEERERPIIESTEAAAAVLRPVLAEKSKEHVVALLLDNRHRLIRMASIAVGSLSASLVHPRELFKEAIAASAAAVIVAHNHPSGDPTPSAHDLALTRRLCDAGALLGIEVLDHVVVARRGCVSLRTQGKRTRFLDPSTRATAFPRPCSGQAAVGSCLDFTRHSSRARPKAESRDSLGTAPHGQACGAPHRRQEAS